ncbi:MAG: Type II secretion system protein D precursor [Deltaproteobacteria bacterium ADurb.Bin151]|nr:MAG: Type II secretion system protein D precursor [Deltaproteobacteria bacterium ADurb.Bin151]HQP24198.1 type II secretion system secretin GspD [Smithellaceae bacterium]
MFVVKRHMWEFLLSLAAAVIFMAGAAVPCCAARIDEGRFAGSSSSRPAVSSTGMKQPPSRTVNQDSPSKVRPGNGSLEDESDPAMTVRMQETILRKAEDTPSAKKTFMESAQKTDAGKYVMLDFDNVNIEVFVKFISELTGKNFIIDEKVKGKVTIVSPKKIPVEDVYKVFLSVLEINGFATVPVGDMIKIVPSSIAREKGLETRYKKDGSGADDRMVTQIITLERSNPDEVKRVLDPIIPKTSSVLSYAPANLLIITDYLSNVRRMQEIVKALDVEGAGEQITYVPLKNASASEVTKSLTGVFQQRRANASPVKIVADPRTNSVIIFASVADTANVRKLVAMMDKDVPRGESNIQIFRLQNSVAEDLAKVLNNIVKETGGASAAAATGTAAAGQKVSAPAVSRNVQVVPDKATNTLIIMAEREDYKILENIIKQLDVPRPMVYIEALIMEVKANKDFKLGVEWSGVKDTGSISGIDGSKSAAFVGSGTGVLSGLTSTVIDTATTALGLPSGFSMGIIGAGIRIGDVLFPSIGAMVQAYKNDTDVSILSTPQLLTLDNEEAEINVGENVPYLTRQDSTSTTSAYPVNYNTYEYKDVGVILTITPNINQENFIRLKISQQVTKVIAGVSTDTTKPSIPTTLKRTAKTTVVVKDNETVVIGGLVGDSTDDSTNKVPFLGEIPIMGWLFKAKTVAREKTNLYIFLTPHIVRTQKDASQLYVEKRGSMGEVVEGIIKLNERSNDAYPSGPRKPAPGGRPVTP